MIRLDSLENVRRGMFYVELCFSLKVTSVPDCPLFPPMRSLGRTPILQPACMLARSHTLPSSAPCRLWRRSAPRADVPRTFRKHESAGRKLRREIVHRHHPLVAGMRHGFTTCLKKACLSSVCHHSDTASTCRRGIIKRFLRDEEAAGSNPARIFNI